jgi:hypothetical protein
MTVKALSKTLTVVDWNKKKGLIATAAVKTGLSEALFKLEQQWHAADWEKLDPERAVANAAVAIRIWTSWPAFTGWPWRSSIMCGRS